MALSISRNHNTLRIQWPAASAGFALESAHALQADAWAVVPISPIVEGDQNVVTVEAETGTQFFRLRRPWLNNQPMLLQALGSACVRQVVECVRRCGALDWGWGGSEPA